MPGIENTEEEKLPADLTGRQDENVAPENVNEIALTTVIESSQDQTIELAQSQTEKMEVHHHPK
jgi:hypothetical protein